MAQIPLPNEVPMIDNTTGLLRPAWLEHLQSLGVAIDENGTIPCPAQDPLMEKGEEGITGRKASKRLAGMETTGMTRPWRDYFNFLVTELARRTGEGGIPYPTGPIIDPETGIITTPWIEWFTKIWNETNNNIFSDAGIRTVQIGQFGVFCDAYHDAYLTSEQETWLVDILKWLQGGRSTGRVWCSTRNDHDFTGMFGNPAGLNQRTVGTDCENAMTAAGFTVTRGAHTTTFDYADDLYDILIVGGTDAFAGAVKTPDFASGEADADRGQMIVDFIQAGGSAIIPVTFYSWIDAWQNTFKFQDSGPFIHNHQEMCTWTTATSVNSDLFRSGIQIFLNQHFYVNVSGGVVEDETRRVFDAEECQDAWNTLAAYSARDDAGPVP